MGAIICEQICPDCKVRLHRTPWNSGDYTIHGKLLSSCPICGFMYPELSRLPTEILSNHQKRGTGVRIAAKYKLDPKQMKTLTSESYETDIHKFIKEIKEKIKSSFGLKLQSHEIYNII